MITKNSKIYIAGHKGMVGSACWRLLDKLGYKNLIGKSSKELDLRNQSAVNKFIRTEKPMAIIDAAAKVGGILANNNFPYNFIMDNLLIQTNLIKAAHDFNVEKFIFLGSSCIYPRESKQPIKEDYLLTGPLEKTNEWYAVAKISGLKLIESIRKQYNRDYVSLMPTNLYGPYDNFDLKTSHVLPAMIRKFHDAKISNSVSVNLWGTGMPMREFLYVDDLAEAVYYALRNKLQDSLYNVGSGYDLKIKDLANLIKEIVSYEGSVNWDISKPDGTKRKIMDSTKFNSLGWEPKYSLEKGIYETYDWYQKNIKNLKYLNF